MNKLIDELKKSPIFNFSLGSKEQYHSDFIYWIGKNYPKIIAPFFQVALPIEPYNNEINDFKREEKHNDIVIKYNNGWTTIIENKVTSLAGLTQLEKYTQRNNTGTSFILLSLSKPSFVNDNNKFVVLDKEWHYLNYEMLSIFLKNNAAEINDKYHKEIILDYSNVIHNLHIIESNFYVENNDIFDFHEKKTNTIYKTLSSIRYADYYLKRKYNSIAVLAYDHFLNNINKETVIEFGNDFDWKNSTSRIWFGNDFTNGSGIFNFKYLIQENLVLGIQIQGEQYRMIIESKNGLYTAIKNDLLEKNLWFNFDKFGQQQVYPKKNPAGFNEYSNTLFFRYVKLGTDRSIDNIINLVFNDYKKIIENREEILNLANNKNTSQRTN